MAFWSMVKIQLVCYFKYSFSIRWPRKLDDCPHQFIFPLQYLQYFISKQTMFSLYTPIYKYKYLILNVHFLETAKTNQMTREMLVMS